jgi:hypothetical protein
VRETVPLLDDQLVVADITLDINGPSCHAADVCAVRNDLFRCPRRLVLSEPSGRRALGDLIDREVSQGRQDRPP